MANRTRRIRTMLLQPHPHRNIHPRTLVLQPRYIGRRRRRRSPQEILQNPLTPNHRRRPRRIRSQRQNRTVRQQAATRRALKRDALKPKPIHPRNPVIPGQRTIQIRELPVNQLQQIPILAEHLTHEHLRLTPHVPQQLVIHQRELHRIRLLPVQRPQIQPLPGKILHQIRGLRILQHPPHLTRQHRLIPQLLLLRQLQQFLIRHAAPKKIRKTRSQVKLAHPISPAPRRRVLLHPKQKRRRNQHRLQRNPHAFLKRITLFLHQRDQLQQPLNLFFHPRTPEPAPSQVLHNLPGTRRIFPTANKQLRVARRMRRRRVIRPQNLHKLARHPPPPVRVQIRPRIHRIRVLREVHLNPMLARRQMDLSHRWCPRVVVRLIALNNLPDNLLAVHINIQLNRRFILPMNLAHLGNLRHRQSSSPSTRPKILTRSPPAPVRNPELQRVIRLHREAINTIQSAPNRERKIIPAHMPVILNVLDQQLADN